MGGDDRTRRAVMRETVGLGLGLSLGLGLAGLPGMATAATPGDFAGEDLWRERVVTPVRIGDGRPLTFAIDSAANSSVIAGDLLGETPHRPIGRVVMHTLAGPEEAEAVIAPRIRSGALDQRDCRLVIGSREGLNGLDGLLGSDLLVGRRLVLRFGKRIQTAIERSRRRGPGSLTLRDPRNRLATPLEQRFHSLVMIDARFGSHAGSAIVDSGAGMTMINTAAARAAEARPLATTTGETVTRVQSPTGRTVPAALAVLPSLSFADASISNLPVLVGDFHTFDLWGLQDRPAGLLGVDVLSLFRTVAIDLRLREFSVTA